MSGIKKDMGAIQRAVQILAGTYDKDILNFEVAKVCAVDTVNWLCTAKLVSSKAQNIYTDIQLTSEKTSNGFVQVPKVGSNVILAITWRNEVYVFMCSEIDALVFHQQNPDGKTFEEFVINCNSKYSPALPLGIQLVDGGGNGIVITSGAATTTNNNGKNGVVISSGTGKVTNDANGITISNSSASISNSSSNILISCSGSLQFNGDKFGGLVKLVDPTDSSGESGVLARLNNIEQWINSFSGSSGTFATHTHVCASPGAPAGSPIAIPPSSELPLTSIPPTVAPPTITQTNKSMIENADITHGPKVN
jgi:hypothetical protein